MLSNSLTRKFHKLFTAVLIVFLLVPFSAFSQTSKEDELRSQIRDIALEMEKIEKEIQEYSKLYNDTTKQSQSLVNALKQLEINKKKLLAELSYTEKQIKSTSLSINDLSVDIGNTESAIDKNSEALAESLVYLNQLESESSIEMFFKYNTLSEAWDGVMNLSRFQRKVNSEIITAKDLREHLVEKKGEIEAEKNKLVNYQENLSDQKSVVEYNQKEKDQLLSVTKSREAEYQRLLAERQKQKEEFERELFRHESELRLIIDPASIPNERKGVLSWPLKDIFVTQYFGRTVDSKRLYTSGTHNGVDFRASIGTPVRAALSGVVTASGNTDISSGCYSYGKWILIKHQNGLSTLYAHLSQVSVSNGQAVSTGDTIGYSGNTGYSTGPHLHFGVYATQGVKVERYVSSNYCKNVIIPLADVKAYLDPIAYLPKP